MLPPTTAAKRKKRKYNSYTANPTTKEYHNSFFLFFTFKYQRKISKSLLFIRGNTSVASQISPTPSLHCPLRFPEWLCSSPEEFRASVEIVIATLGLRATACIAAVIVGTIVDRVAALSLGSAEVGPERPRQRYPEPSLGHPWGGSSGGGGSVLLLMMMMVVVGVVRGQLEAADGAGAVEFKPREDAVLVEDVVAGELLGGGAELEVVHADGALRAPVGLHHVGGDGDVGERGDGGLGGGRGAVAVGVVLGELLDELLEAGGAHEVVGEAEARDEGWTGAPALEDDLDGGAVGEEAAEVVVDEVGGVEEAGRERAGGGRAEEGGEVAGVAQVKGGGCGRWRGGIVEKLLDESASAAGAEDIGVQGCGRGDGDGAVALVAVVAPRRRRRLGGRHGRIERS